MENLPKIYWKRKRLFYYERCAFIIEIPEITAEIGGNLLSLSIGGIRALNQENLYSKKSFEKFKLFIGFKNSICTNLCISTDGFSNTIRASSTNEVMSKAYDLFTNYNKEEHFLYIAKMLDYSLSEKEFAHLIGRMKMFSFIDKKGKNNICPLGLTDSQIGKIVKEYYHCPNFGRKEDGSLPYWNLYNLLTEAIKSSYIDSYLERSVNAYGLVQELAFSIDNGTSNWYLPT